MAKKTGNLNEYERRFIIDNCRKMSIEDIAEELNRTPELVKNTLMSRGLYGEKTSEEIEEENRLKMLLYRESFWPELVKAYVEDEIDFFEAEWVKFQKQLSSDVSHTEALFIKDWICNEIEKFRVQKKYKMSEEQIATLIDQIKQIEDTAPQDLKIEDMQRLTDFKAQLAMMTAASASFVSLMEKLHQHTKVFSAKIQADREKRREVKTDASTYWGYLELLNDEKFRKEESYKAEIGRIAQAKARNELMQLEQYVDGTVDYPLLNADTMEQNDV